jgi:NNP family nitrate/nitrite transporter-like MFS transporter
MNNLLTSLKSGDWRALLASFLYFDTGFTVWVMYGPLAPAIAKDYALNDAQKGFLVAVPVLAAAILRVTFGNMYQAIDGRRLALLGIALSAIPPAVLLLMPGAPSLPLLLSLGVLLGMGGASFAVALPMAGSNYPREVQGLVLGLAAAGNIGAVLDGFLFPSLAEHFGWQRATAASLPLLALTAAAVVAWSRDRAPKSGEARVAVFAFVASLAFLLVLVLIVNAGLFGLGGKTGLMLLPVFGSLLAIAVLPARYRAVFGERDTWAMMLIYSITFGGFVGMSSYVVLLLTNLYGMSKIDAGLWMAALAFTGAMVRPLGGALADRISGVRALGVLLPAIATADLAFALWQPPLAGGIALLFVLYLCFGLGNGATFQLVPLRWPDKTGTMAGIIGAAGGIGGFYLPVVLGIARDSTGGYGSGFLFLAGAATLASLALLLSRGQWLRWASPTHEAEIAVGEPVHAE